jgi:hypothetical protein
MKERPRGGDLQGLKGLALRQGFVTYDDIDGVVNSQVPLRTWSARWMRRSSSCAT